MPHLPARTVLLALAVTGCGEDAPVTPTQRSATLSVVRGAGQQAVAGYVLADTIVVELRDAEGTPMPYAPIHASTATVLGRVIVVDALTGENGSARLVWRTGLALGVQHLEVTTGADADVAPLVIEATAQSQPMQEVVGGAEVLCGITPAGALGCWRPLDDPDHPPRFVPHATAERFAALALHRTVAGDRRGCATSTTGRVWCFGVSEAGAITDLAEMPGDYPPLVTVHTATGGSATSPTFCALGDDGSAWCWGDNRWGTVGDGSTVRRDQVTAIGTALRFTSIAVGVTHVCATATDGIGWCWGRNHLSQLGRIPSDDPIPFPVPRTGILRYYAVAPVSEDASCGVVRDNGGVYCWGSKYSAGIGNLAMGLIEEPSFSFPIFAAGAGRGNEVGTVDRASVVLGSDGQSAWWGRLEPGVEEVFAYGPRPFLHQLPLVSLTRSHTEGVFCGAVRDSQTMLCGRMMTLTGYPSHQVTPQLSGFGMPLP